MNSKDMVDFVERVLLRAAEIVDAGWTQKSPARDGNGNPVFSHHQSATCFCAVGAIFRAISETENCQISGDLASLPIARLSISLGMGNAGNVASWNDHPKRTKEEVVAALRKAATLAPPSTELSERDSRQAAAMARLDEGFPDAGETGVFAHRIREKSASSLSQQTKEEKEKEESS